MAERLPWGKHYLMVAPHHYRVDYSINPYMDPSVPVDHALAWKQWRELKEAIEAAGGTVEVLETQPPDCPDMVYAMNLGYAMQASSGEKRVLVSRMRWPERQAESEVAAAWFAAHGYELHEIEPSLANHLESGDMFPLGPYIVAGTGPRTNEETLAYLRDASGMPTVALESISDKAYHLDLSYCPLTPTAALVWPGAFSPQDFDGLLTFLPYPIALTDREALEDFSANSIVVGDTIIMPARASKRLQALLSSDFGFTVKLVDVSEFEKGGGSVRCLTNPLDLPCK